MSVLYVVWYSALSVPLYILSAIYILLLVVGINAERILLRPYERLMDRVLLYTQICMSLFLTKPVSENTALEILSRPAAETSSPS